MFILADHYFRHELPAHIEYPEPHGQSKNLFILRTVDPLLCPVTPSKLLSQMPVVAEVQRHAFLHF